MLCNMYVSNDQNTMRGGLYRYKLEGNGIADVEPQVWLPLAGPDITTYWQSEINYFKNTWGPAYQAKLNQRTKLFILAPLKRGMLKKSFALNDMRTLGQALDWTGDIKG